MHPISYLFLLKLTHPPRIHDLLPYTLSTLLCNSNVAPSSSSFCFRFPDFFSLPRRCITCNVYPIFTLTGHGDDNGPVATLLDFKHLRTRTCSNFPLLNQMQRSVATDCYLSNLLLCCFLFVDAHIRTLTLPSAFPHGRGLYCTVDARHCIILAFIPAVNTTKVSGPCRCYNLLAEFYEVICP